jgi:hypothetical protein
MREPRMDEAELAALRPVIVAPDGVSLTELAGSTLLLLDSDPTASDPIEGDTLDNLDVDEVELRDGRVFDLAHLVKWAVANGY